MTTKQPIKKPTYPKHYIRLVEETNLFRLVFDGLEGVPIPYKLRLSEIGAKNIQTALCNMPVFVSDREFWGYKDCPFDEEYPLVCGDKTGYYHDKKCNEGTNYITLDCHDEMALIALANVLSDARCWKEYE